MPGRSKSKLLSRLGQKEREEVQEVRNQVLDRIMIPFLILGSSAVVLGVVRALRQGDYAFSLIYSFLYLVLLMSWVLKKRIHPGVRTLVVVSIVFVLGVAILARMGMSGVGLEVLIIGCALSSVLLGVKVGLAVTAASIVIIIVIASGMLLGAIPVQESHMLTSLSPSAWAIAVLVFVMAGACLVLIPQRFMDRLKASLEEEEQKGEELRRSYTAMEKEMKSRQEVQDALRESEERYRLLVKHAPAGIYEIDVTNGRIMSVNDVMCELTGYTTEEFLSLAALDLITPETLPTFIERQQKAFAGEPISDTAEYKIRAKNGREFWVLVNSKLIYRDAVPLKATVVVYNITDIKTAQEDLRRSEQRYRDLFSSISDLIYTQDLDGRFLSINPALSKTFGYEEKELLGRRASEFMKPELRPLFQSEYLDQIKSKGAYQGISSYSAKDGRIVYIEYRSTLVTPETGPRYITGTGRDVTEKVAAQERIKHLQEQVLQAQKMEAIGTLAGGIAHDFNNLLMGIQGNISLMLMDMDSSNPDCEKLKNMESYVRSGADLTRQLLGFARAGKYEVKPTHLNELIRKGAEMFSRTKKEIRIHAKYEDKIWPVDVDRAQMGQVMLNLYVNAWQAMPAGGNLYLETDNVLLEEEYVRPHGLQPGKYVKISVADTGVGMDDKTRQRVFDPFFTTKERGRGTGLGLASAYGIIRNHGGIITVESEKGQGSLFAIYLPSSKGEVKEEKAPKEGTFPGKGTVLLVDDEEMIIDVGSQMLERLGYGVLTAKGGKEALRVFEDNKDAVDVVVLDMIMPDMRGGEVFDRIKEIDSRARVLLCSGYSVDGQAQEILDRGCDGFIQKPFTLSDLSRKLREATETKQAPQPAE